MFEAASCAIHGLDRIAPKAGSTVLMIGAGPTGLCLAQLLKLNGAAHMVLAANAGPKMELAKKLACADEYVDLDREHPQAQWAELKEKYTYGFDVVIEASGSVQVLKDSIGYVARGGTLLYYGVYPKQALVDVSPSKVFGDEITIIGYVGLLRRDLSEKLLLTAGVQVVFADVVLAALDSVLGKSEGGCSGDRLAYFCPQGFRKGIGCSQEQDLYQVDDRL